MMGEQHLKLFAKFHGIQHDQKDQGPDDDGNDVQEASATSGEHGVDAGLGHVREHRVDPEQPTDHGVNEPSDDHVGEDQVEGPDEDHHGCSHLLAFYRTLIVPIDEPCSQRWQSKDRMVNDAKTAFISISSQP